jgi:hypothetical protein
MASAKSSHLFKRARLDMRQAEKDQEIQTLPQLVEYNATHNPNYPFCLQAQKNFDHADTAIEDRFIRITHQDVKFAILRCQKWLLKMIQSLHSPKIHAEDSVTKCAPVAVFMESDVGLFIYLMALVSLGCPVRERSWR